MIGRSGLHAQAVVLPQVGGGQGVVRAVRIQQTVRNQHTALLRLHLLYH